MTEIVAEVFGISVLDKKELLGKPFNSVPRSLFLDFLKVAILKNKAETISLKTQENLSKKSTALGIFFD